MAVIDEFTGRKISCDVVRFIVDIIDDIFIYGYTRHKELLKIATFYISGKGYFREKYNPKTITNVIWSTNIADYICLTGLDYKTRLECDIMQRNSYCYSFEKKYEAVQNFKLFNDKQIQINDLDFPISHHVKRTIGLEFETSIGVISESDCFKYGLIPLRDGSITGIEFSTVILQGNTGFNLLKKQLELLRANTYFNKDCSLHIHFGGYPLDTRKIYRLHRSLYYLQDEILQYIPAYSFSTEKFKSNGKSYCKKFTLQTNFDSLFQSTVGTKFYGSFEQPHPADRNRDHKWNISSRYYWCNLVNLLCYNVNKTVEFRFLRPTFNLEKILTWIYILNAILIYAENYTEISPLPVIITKVYPPETAQMVCQQLHKLYCLTQTQFLNGDYIGADIPLEDRFFDCNKII